jgi:hypothetical protein
MIADGYYPNLIVDPEWYEPKHPQESLPSVRDPTSLFRPAPERDQIGAVIRLGGVPAVDTVPGGGFGRPLGPQLKGPGGLGGGAGGAQLPFGYALGKVSSSQVPAPPASDPVGTLLAFSSDVGFERLYSTADGVGFSNQSLDFDFIVSNIGNFVAFNQNQITFGAATNYTSTDGGTWVNRSAAGGNPWGQGLAEVANLQYWQVSGLFAVFPRVGSTYFTSADGVSWTSRSGAHWGTTGPVSYATDGVHDYVIAASQVWRSTDGIAWSGMQFLGSTQDILYLGSGPGGPFWTFGNSGAFWRVHESATGGVGTFVRNLVAEASLDGAGLVGANNPVAVVHSNGIGKFALGFNIAGVGSNSTRYAFSTDGNSWTNPGSTLNGTNLRYSATLGEFVRTTLNFVTGELLRSSDGISWSSHQYATFPASAVFDSADLLTSF